jgi:hypothetical protein
MRHESSTTEPNLRDVYFSADVETDGPIPGPFSMLSVGIVVAGQFDGNSFTRPSDFKNGFYAELRPISNQFQAEALAVNKLDRNRLLKEGEEPQHAITRARDWITTVAAGGKPVLVAYPLSFDWMWLFWYFTQFLAQGSPFSYSSCYDLKTAYSVKAKVPINEAGRSRVPSTLRGTHPHTHHALDDAIEQAELFANIFEWDGQ